MTAKEYLQKKHEWHRKHWNEHEHIDDEWWANQMEEYHLAKLKLLGIADVVGQSEQLSKDVLKKAIAKAKPNMDKIDDVDEWLDSIR
jgi:hypothetical protein